MANLIRSWQSQLPKNKPTFVPIDVSEKLWMFLLKQQEHDIPSGKHTVCELEHGHRNSGFTQL